MRNPNALSTQYYSTDVSSRANVLLHSHCIIIENLYFGCCVIAVTSYERPFLETTTLLNLAGLEVHIIL